MAYVTNDQIAAARELALLTYLQRYMPEELVKAGGGTYSTRSHDSLKISNGKWYWWSRKIGGVSALDYLVKVLGFPLPVAVAHIYDCAGRTLPAPVRPRGNPQRTLPTAANASPRASPARMQDDGKTLVLPEAYPNNRRVFAYLSSRGIDGEIISFCIEHRMLYEDAVHHNAVFVGYDGKIPRYGFARSTLSCSTFMRELTGSEKRFCFQIPARKKDANMVCVFESAIDALSFASILKQDGVDWRMAHYLSLGGAAMKKEGLPPALVHFLAVHSQVQKLVLCLDNDSTGQRVAQTIIAAAPNFRAAYVPPTTGKDFNEMLCAMKGITHSARTRGHKGEVR